MHWKIPLSERSVRGLRCDLPRLTLLVLTKYQTFAPVPFTLDTGADFVCLPTSLAESERIVFPRSASTRARATGLVGAADYFRGVLFVRIRGDLFRWPCNFVDSPHRSLQYGVLGRSAVLDDFSFCIDSRFLTLRRLWPS